MRHQFIGHLEKYEHKLYNFHLKVPAQIVRLLKNEKIKRFLCQINEGNPFHASLIPAGEQEYFIKINKELREQHKMSLGTQVQVTILEDNTPYGMPLPTELQELFQVDPEGDRYFHQLTPGKQRSLIFLVSKSKDSDKRIEKSIIIIEHLKEQMGNLNFKILHEDFKNKKRSY